MPANNFLAQLRVASIIQPTAKQLPPLFITDKPANTLEFEARCRCTEAIVALGLPEVFEAEDEPGSANYVLDNPEDFPVSYVSTITGRLQFIVTSDDAVLWRKEMMLPVLEIHMPLIEAARALGPERRAKRERT